MSGVRMHFCTETARAYGGVLWPTKYGTNCTMPALTNRRLGSASGNGADGTTVWPFASKCFRNLRLISAVLIAEPLLRSLCCRYRAACGRAHFSGLLSRPRIFVVAGPLAVGTLLVGAAVVAVSAVRLVCVVLP